MAQCSFAEWRGPIPNMGGQVSRPAKGLVVHVEVGTEAGTDSAFHNPHFQASAHFGCAKDGHLQQWVDTDNKAWAQVDGNTEWISVETEGMPDEPLTQAQVDSIAKLFLWLHSLYGFPLQTADHDGTGLTTHAHYPSGVSDPNWGSHTCPGTIRSAQLPAILAKAKGQVAPTPTVVDGAFSNTPNGSWLAFTDGVVHPEGDALPYGSASGLHLVSPVSAITISPRGAGYYLVAENGGVFTYGDAAFFGAMTNPPAAKIVDIKATNNGYYLAGADGGVLTFGDAKFFGSMGGKKLAKPIVAMETVPGGYYLVSQDGGIFTFGGAQFLGSLGGTGKVNNIVDMAATPDGKGYWLLGADGGIFNFGTAKFAGSYPGLPSAERQGTRSFLAIKGLNNDHYWILANDGGIYRF